MPTDNLFLLIPFAVIIFFSIFMWLRSRKPGKPREDHATRQRRAVWAMAAITEMKTEPSSLGTMSRVHMSMHIHLPGSEPYDAKTTWLVKSESLDLLEIGKDIGVHVDPQNPQYIYPGGNWATFVE